MVLLMTELNCRDDIKDYRDGNFPVARPAKSQLRKFATYRLLRRLIKGGVRRSAKDDHEIKEAVNQGNPPPLRYTIEQFYQDFFIDLNKVHQLSINWGFELVILSSFEKYQIECIRKKGFEKDTFNFIGKSIECNVDKTPYDFALENKLPYIDLTQAIAKVDPKTQDIWNDPAHCNGIGNRIMAQTISDGLNKAGLIPKN